MLSLNKVARPQAKTVECVGISDRHVICALVKGVGPLSMSAQPQHVLQAVRSPITKAWTNQDLCTTNVTPFNEYNCPGLKVCDLFADWLTCKFSSVGGKSKEEHAKALKACRKVLKVAFRNASSVPDSITMVCNMSVSLSHSSLQAVTAWDTWKKERCIAQDWTVVGWPHLTMLNPWLWLVQWLQSNTWLGSLPPSTSSLTRRT